MEEQLIRFETAKLAKKNGLSGLFEHYYDDDGELKAASRAHSDWGHSNHFSYQSAPTQSLLQKWFRDSRSWFIEIDASHGKTFDVSISYFAEEHKKTRILCRRINKTYEESLEIGLIEALKMI